MKIEQSEFFGLLQKKEPLDPALGARIVSVPGIGSKLEHPLCVECPYLPQLNALYNRRLKALSERLAREVEAENWKGVIALYARPFRFEALLDYGAKMDPVTYWQTLAYCVQDTENFWQASAVMPHFLSLKPDADRHEMMGPEEREILAAFPETVTVYRGCRWHNKRGWSWTMVPGVAEWFARRFNKSGFVLTGTVARKDIIAYWDSRGESEVFVRPESVTITKTRAITPGKGKPAWNPGAKRT